MKKRILDYAPRQKQINNELNILGNGTKTVSRKKDMAVDINMLIRCEER